MEKVDQIYILALIGIESRNKRKENAIKYWYRPFGVRKRYIHASYLCPCAFVCVSVRIRIDLASANFISTRLPRDFFAQLSCIHKCDVDDDDDIWGFQQYWYFCFLCAPVVIEKSNELFISCVYEYVIECVITMPFMHDVRFNYVYPYSLW